MDHVVLETEPPETAAPETETQKVTEPPQEETQEETETETETEEESAFEKAADFVQDNLILCIACLLVLIALLIILISFLQRNKQKRDEFDTEELPTYDQNNDPAGAEKTLDDTEYDDEGTIDDLNLFDDEETVYGAMDNGLRLEFEISFAGQTETVERVMKEQLVLGRGSECDVDVVLHSALEERKQTSRRHAFILEHPDGLYVKDNSKNKTYLNGVEVAGETALRDEDVLQLGKATVKIKILSY
jgi:pSer/pThr/pTyr-binding forkhead associated (FHA) protein